MDLGASQALLSPFSILSQTLRIFLQMAPKDIDTQSVYWRIKENSGATDSVHELEG
jgi:hypothetical protein